MQAEIGLSLIRAHIHIDLIKFWRNQSNDTTHLLLYELMLQYEAAWIACYSILHCYSLSVDTQDVPVAGPNICDWVFKCDAATVRQSDFNFKFSTWLRLIKTDPVHLLCTLQGLHSIHF